MIHLLRTSAFAAPLAQNEFVQYSPSVLASAVPDLYKPVVDIGSMDRSKDETEAYEQALKHLVVGDSTQYRLAAPSRNVDGGLTKSPMTITENVKFDIEKNELGFETEGVQGGTHSLLLRFGEKKVYHAHGPPSDTEATSAIYNIRIVD